MHGIKIKKHAEANANPSYGMTTSAQLSKFTNWTEKSNSRTIPSYFSRALKFQERYQIGCKPEEISSQVKAQIGGEALHVTSTNSKNRAHR
jgi:hypothetical protein